MASAVEQVQMRLQEAMERGNQASLGQAIYASKGVNGLKQLRRSAKARLKQISADQNREMIGSYMPQEEPLTWRTSEQGDRYRAVAHLSTSIIGWVIGHKGCNARMLKQQTGTELWVDVPGQCVIIVAKTVEELEGAMEAVNGFVKTAPTFIAKVQAGHRGGITQTLHCPVHLLPSIQRLSRKIQIESGANYVFANSKMSTFCVTGERKSVDTAVTILKRLISEGNSDTLAATTAGAYVGDSHANGNYAGGGGSSRDPIESSSSSSSSSNMSRVWSETRHRLRREGSALQLSYGDGSPPTAPCSPDDTTAASVWGNGVSSSQPLTWSVQAAAASANHNTNQSRSNPCLASASSMLGNPAPFQGASSGGLPSDLSFFSFGVSDLDAGRLALPGEVSASREEATRASTAPTSVKSCSSSVECESVRAMLPGLGFLEESAGSVREKGYGEDFVDEEGRTSSCGSGEFGGGEAHSLLANSRQPGSTGSLGVRSGSGGGGVGGGGGGGGGCPEEDRIEHVLEELGLSKYLPVFRSAEVDLLTLSIMSEQDLRDLGILKGPRVKIMHHIGSR